MEITLNNTDIFDENLDEKFRSVIVTYSDDICTEKIYRFVVSFHVNLLNDQRFEKIEVPQSKLRKNTKNDSIYDLLRSQLKRLEQILSEQGIVAYNRTIQGTYLDTENIIKIEITEDNITAQSDLDKTKSKSQLKIRSIVPSLPFTQETISRLASESLSKVFIDLMEVIRNKKIMSEILGIELTEDENELFKSFFDQYHDLWLPTDERKNELLNKLQERSKLVLNKYSNKHYS